MNAVYCTNSGDIKNLRNSIQTALTSVYEQFIQNKLTEEGARNRFIDELSKVLSIKDDSLIESLEKYVQIGQSIAAYKAKSKVYLFKHDTPFRDYWKAYKENSEEIKTQTEEVLHNEQHAIALEEQEIFNTRFFDIAYSQAVAVRDAALRRSKEEIMSALMLNRTFRNGLGLIATDSDRVTALRAYQRYLAGNILSGLQKVLTIDSKFSQTTESYEDFLAQTRDFYRTYNEAIWQHFTPTKLNEYYEAEVHDPKASIILEGYRSYIILNNFDSMLSLTIGDELGIKPQYRGVQPGKYSLNVTTSKQMTVNNAEDHDAVKETSKVIKALIEATPYYSWDPILKIFKKIPGKYLGYADFACVSAQIKDLVYDAKIANQTLLSKNDNGDLYLTTEGQKCLGLTPLDRGGGLLIKSLDKSTLNADQAELLDYIANYLPNLLSKSTISLQDIIDAHRINPIKNYGIMINIMASDYFWTDILQGIDSSNKYLKALTTPFRNAVQSIYRGITSLSNTKSINYILKNQPKHNINDYYAWIAQNADSVQNTKFLQYYINVDGQLSVRELYDQQVEQQKQRIKFAINTLGRPKLYFNLDNLKKTYEIKYNSTNSEGNPFKIFGFLIKGGDKTYKVIVKDPIDPGCTVRIYEESETKYENYLKDEEISNLGQVLFPFINALTGQRFSEESEYFQHYCNLMPKNEALPKLLALAARLYYVRNAIDSTNVMQTFRNGTVDYDKYLVKTYTSDIGLAKLKIDPVLQDVDLIYNDQDARTLFNLAEAKVIALGLSLSSQIKNGEGNGLGLVGLSRLINSLPSQVKTQCLSDDSAVGQMTLINTPGLYQGVYKMEEAKLEAGVTNHTDFTVAEFGTSQFLLDFVGGLMTTNTVGDRSAIGNGKVALLASVNSDKTFIGRLLLDLNTEYSGKIAKLKGKKFKDFTNEDLDEVIINDFGAVYNTIVNHINQDWKLLGTFIRSIPKENLPEPLQVLYDYLYVINEDETISANDLTYDTYDSFNEHIEKYAPTQNPVQIIKAAVREYNRNKANNWKVAALSMNEELTRLIGVEVTFDQLDTWVNDSLSEDLTKKQVAVKALRIIHNKLHEIGFSPVIAFYNNFHYRDGGKKLEVNSTLTTLVNRFNSVDRTQYYEFFNTKNYELVKSAVNNGFELVLPDFNKDKAFEGQEVDPRHPAIQYLRDLLTKEFNQHTEIGSWIALDEKMVYAKIKIVDTENGNKPLYFDITNQLSIQHFQRWLNSRGINTLNYNFYKDFTSLRKFFESRDGKDLQGELIINPVINKWNKMDYLFTQEFMYASVGSHISHDAKATDPMKDLKAAYESILKQKNNSQDPDVQKAYREYQFAIESARFFAQHKRNVAMTASKREFLLNYLMGIPNKYNISIIKDIKDVLANFSGLIDDSVKPYDGGCYVNPTIVLLENASLGAERAGVNKKQFGHFYNQRMSAAGILKMAGFGLTSETMRHNLMDRIMCKHMMEKKWTRRLDFEFNPFQDALLYQEHIYNLLEDYDGERINYNEGAPLYYESQVSFQIPEGFEPETKFSVVHRSKVTNENNIVNISRLNAPTIGRDNLGDFVLIVDNENGRTANPGDIFAEKFYWERTFDEKHAFFIDGTAEQIIDGMDVTASSLGLVRGQYVFKDRLLDAEVNRNGDIILNTNSRDLTPVTESIQNIVVTDVVDNNYKALTEVFMGYRAVDANATNIDMELLKSFEYTPLEIVRQKVGPNYLKQSEISIALLVEAQCAVGDKRAGVTKVRTQDDVWQPLKYSDIHYGVTAGAIKQFAANVNEAKAYNDYNYDWDYYEIYARELGIQLDKEHHADKEEVSLMNQVVSALSARGFSTNIARNAYKAIATLTEVGLRQFKGLDDYLDYVYTKKEGQTPEEIDQAKKAKADAFIKCVKRVILSQLKNATTRDGEFIRNIATAVTMQLVEDKDLAETPVTLAGSDNLLYNKVSSILASVFTNDAIKTKLQGILSVLCPSHQRVKTYAGSLLGHQDMATLIKKHRLAQQNNLLGKLTTIQLNTTYTVKYANDRTESWTPKTPHDIYAFKQKMEVAMQKGGAEMPVGLFENILAGRDLGHYNAYFQITDKDAADNYVTRDCSLMDLDSVRLLSEWEYNIKAYYQAIEDKDEKAKISFKTQCLAILGEIKESQQECFYGALMPLLTPDEQVSIRSLIDTNSIVGDKLFEAIVFRHGSGQDDVVELALRRILQSDLIALSPNSEIVFNNEAFRDANERYNTDFETFKQWLRNSNRPNRIALKDIQWSETPSEFYYRAWNKMRESGSEMVKIGGEWRTIDKTKITIKPYELIMSKTLKSLLGLRDNECVQDLLNDPQVFAKRLVNKFESKLASEDLYSVQLKRGDGNHINVLHRSQFSNVSAQLKSVPLVTVVENGNVFRIGENKSKLYQVQPQDSLYVDEYGNEIIVTDKLNFYLDNLSYLTFVFSNQFTDSYKTHFNIVVENLSASKSENVKKWLKGGNSWLEHKSKGKDDEVLEDITLNLDNLKNFNITLKSINLNSLSEKADTWTASYLKRLGNDMYSSFVKTLQTVAARIPAQSMQSFMPMIIVDYCDADLNVAYVSTSQIWLQGSDFDIDAVSLAGYSLDRNGKFVGWSPYFNLHTATTLEKSCKLDFPTGELIKPQSITDTNRNDANEKLAQLYEILGKYINNESIVYKIRKRRRKTKDKSIVWVPELSLKTPNDENADEYFNALNDLFRNIPVYDYKEEDFKNYVKEIKGEDSDVAFTVTISKDKTITYTFEDLVSIYKQLQGIVNTHNNYINTAPADDVENMSKNLLVHSMFLTTQDPVNLIESQAPVDEVTKPYKKLANQAEEFKDLITFTPGNVWNKILAIHINQVGKDGISRCAVGMKAFFATTQAANYILEHGTAEQQRRLMASKQTVQTWKDAGVTISGFLANLRCKTVDNISETEVLEALMMIDNDHDAALVLSALMSLATDNAKELSLGNLNAGTKLIPLYIYGITQGIPFKDLHRIITSDLGWTCARLFEGNFVTGKRGLFDFNSVLNHLIIGPQSITREANNAIHKEQITPLGFVSDTFTSTLIKYYPNANNLADVVGKKMADAFNIPATTAFSNLFGFFANTSNLNNLTEVSFDTKFEILDKLKENILSNSSASNALKAASLRFVAELEQYLKDVSTIYLDANGNETFVYSNSDYYGRIRESPILDALENLAIGAQELTQVGQILSINNGLRSKLFEQWQFIDNLENVINTTALAHNSKNNRLWFRGDQRDDSKKPNLSKRSARLVIDIHKFLTDDNYAEEKATLLNKYTSSSYNLLDILRNNDNFKSFVKAAIFDNAAVGSMSAKFRTYNTLLQKAFELMKANTTKERQRVAKGVENLFDDFVFRQWLGSKDFKVKILKNHTYLKYDQVANTIHEEVAKEDFDMSLASQDGLANFKFIMENYVFPDIKSGRNTYFANGRNDVYMSEVFDLLSPIVTDRNPIHQSATAYTLDINMAPREDSERVILNHIRGEFNRLSSQMSNIISYTNVQNSTAQTIDIKDLFWLYNQVVFFGKNGEQTLNSLFDEYNVHDPVSKSYRQFLQDFDYGEHARDLVYGSNVTENELKLYTGFVIDQWSSNLNYGFIRSHNSLKHELVQLIKETAYTEDELQEYDLESEDNAQFWGKKARYAIIPDVIPPDKYANYYIRGLVTANETSDLLNRTVNIGRVPFQISSFVDKQGNLKHGIYISVANGQTLGSIYSWIQEQFKNSDQTLRDMMNTLFQIDANIDWTRNISSLSSMLKLGNQFDNLTEKQKEEIRKKITQAFNLFPEKESEQVFKQLQDPYKASASLAYIFNQYFTESSSILKDYRAPLIYNDTYGIKAQLKKRISELNTLLQNYTTETENTKYKDQLIAMLKEVCNTAYKQHGFNKSWYNNKQISEALPSILETMVNQVVNQFLNEYELSQNILNYLNNLDNSLTNSKKLEELLRVMRVTINTEVKTIPVTKVKTSTTQVVTQYDANALKKEIENVLIQTLKGCK